MEPLLSGHLLQLTAWAGWLQEHLIVWSTLQQLAVVALLLALARYFGTRSADWLEGRLNGRYTKTPFVHASYHEIFFLCYSVLFLWTSTLMAEGLEQPFAALKTVASLTTAWAIIRFTSSTIESRFWSRLVALSLWVLAALNIVGWLEPAVLLLDKAALDVGNFKLSLLLVIKGLLAFGVLVWVIGIMSKLLGRSFSRAHGLTPSQRVLFHKLSNIALYTFAFLIGLNIIGIDLTALTVFSGALGLGVGFGLQKIFSNLISGIILLLDKSIKPGDVIAVGNSYGWVNKLGARCVSVLTRDGKEHLIPNESLVSQQVENWSYSDQKVRLHIPIGVAYGSDLRKVKELLLEAARSHPRILKDPTPNCLIMGFSELAINHEIRAWIDDPAAGVSNVKSDIYYRIWDMFVEHGIDIPRNPRETFIKLEPSVVSALTSKK